MSSENLKKALESIPLERFDGIVPDRRSHIEPAPASMPEYDFNTNKVARALHPAKQTMKITEIEDLPNAKRFRLSCDHPAVFAAGQYISVMLKIGSTVTTRPYAISSSPAAVKDGYYEITVKRVKNGFVSDYILDNWKVGDTVDVSAPEGQLYYEPLRDASTVVCLAGGSGITPFYSMAQALRDGVESFNMVLLYGCRSEAEIIYHKELDEIAAACPSFKVVYVLSDEASDGFEKGFITADLIKKYAPSGDYSVFVCGPAAMYSFVSGEIASLGLPIRRVRYEAAGTPLSPAGEVKEYTITIDTKNGRVKIPAKSNETILTAIERAGIVVHSRCRSGECGWCRTRLKSGDVYAPEAAEKRRAADIKDGYIHPCCTFPRGDLRILVDVDLGEVKREVKDMKKKERTMGLIMAIIMSLAMGVLVAFLIPKFNPQAAESQPVAIRYISNILMSVITGVIVSFVVPLGKMGRALANKAGANPPSMKFTLLNCIPLAAGNTIIVSLVCSLVGVIMGRSHMPAEMAASIPFVPMWLKSWGQLLLPTLLASYVLAVVVSPFVSQAVGMGGPPTGGDVPRE